MATTSSLGEGARKLIEHLAETLQGPLDGSSSMSPVIYDTAWVAMVYKAETAAATNESRNFDEEGKDIVTKRLLFPQCLRFVLESQSDLDGGFGTHTAEVDGILNTAAALLALVRYQKHIASNPLNQAANENDRLNVPPSGLPEKLHRGFLYLDKALQAWDVHSCVHVGFEILVPNVLRILETENPEWSFKFPGREALERMCKHKTSRIRPEKAFYANRLPVPSALHSLEAFTGIVDFDRVSHHLCPQGSLMGSPSATAAYLMNCSAWDDRAEEYLRLVVQSGKDGSVPSCFPIPVFEIGWSLSTLLGAGFSVEELGEKTLHQLAEYLEGSLVENGGKIGFAPGMPCDVDDTAKAITSLNLLGRRVDCEGMISAFEETTHFKTYDCEVKPSFSANCNALSALLSVERPSPHGISIAKALGYVCRAWHDGEFADKWNLEPQYCMMLLSDSLFRILELWDNGEFAELPAGKTSGDSNPRPSESIPLVTLQLLVRTLSSQSSNGSWRDGSCEVTAYAILTLKKLINLPWIRTPTVRGILATTAEESIRRGEMFLRDHQQFWDKPELIWVEKVTYGSWLLSKMYCLAALKAPVCRTTYTPGSRVDGLFATSDSSLAKWEKTCKFFSQLPVLSGEPSWRIHASFIEGIMMFQPLMSDGTMAMEKRLPVLGGGDGRQQQSRYLGYIPTIWTMCNNANGFGITNRTMWSMILLSVLNFRIDKHLENVTSAMTNSRDQAQTGEVLEELHHIVDATFGGLSTTKSPNGSNARQKGLHPNGHSLKRKRETQTDYTRRIKPSPKKTDPESEPPHSMSTTQESIQKFMTCVLQDLDPRVREGNTSPTRRQRLVQELSVFLHAHITQGQDNHDRQQRQQALLDPLSSTVTNGDSTKRGGSVFASPSKHGGRRDDTYFNWVRTTSADHTSCPFSFEFFLCLVDDEKGQPGNVGDRPSHGYTSYLLQDLARHLATMCRQYNDLGSAVRDKEESNLNSLDFFMPLGDSEADSVVGGAVTSTEDSAEGGLDKTADRAKETVMAIAQYERECLNLVMENLKTALGVENGETSGSSATKVSSLWKALQVFVSVTDMFGQVYLVRDINSRAA